MKLKLESLSKYLKDNDHPELLRSKRLKEAPELSFKNQLVKDHLMLVKQVVNKFSYLQVPDLEEDDLISCGIIGLLEAANKFEAEKGKSFPAFALPRIRGAIFDQLRLSDCLSRGARKRVKQLSNCIAELEKELHMTPSDKQIANKLNISLEDLHSMQREASINTISLDASLNEETDDSWLNQLCDTKAGPEEKCEAQLLRENLEKAIEELPEREKLIIGLYHYRKLTMKEIAGILKVSESRACQIHNRGIALLKSKLETIYGQI